MFVQLSMQLLMLLLFIIHVMCLLLIFCEDINIGFVLLKDLQKKYICVYLHKQ